MSEVKSVSKNKKKWKTGQTRTFQWTQGASDLFGLSADEAPKTFKARLNKNTVTLSANHDWCGIAASTVVRVDRREFFA